MGETCEADAIYGVVFKNNAIIGQVKIDNIPKNNWINFTNLIPTSVDSLKVIEGDIIYFGLAIDQESGLTQWGTSSVSELPESNIYYAFETTIYPNGNVFHEGWTSDGDRGLAAIIQYSPIINSNAILTEEFYNTVLTQAYYDAILN